MRCMSNNLYPIQSHELEKIVAEGGPVSPSLGGTTPLIEKHQSGLSWKRLFGNGDPYDSIKWVIRTAKITKGDGKIVFQQDNIEVPDFWTQTAIDIVASKYFRGRLNTPQRETSARQMVNRVADTVAGWGFKDGYFATEEDCQNFKADLKYLLINQYAAFNSPVWFNVGVDERPQCSACFILAVEDNMGSIIDWYRDEAWIFKGGSGSGTNLSKLRSSHESLSKGGTSSGPVSFMKGADGIANAVKSGGTTRRAAKMVVLNVDHPDIKNFIESKQKIEEMVRVLEASGVSNSLEGNLFDPYTLLPYQNANNSVRVTDEFMTQVEEDGNWELKAVTTGKTVAIHKAREVMNWISESAWKSADPGMQYDTTINDWHTCPASGRINASNPCAEYMHLDNSACNLASINVLKFLTPSGAFDVVKYKKAIDTMITAQEILVSNSSYPTPRITQNAIDYRELGLGYANLGALLMNLGYPYDSEGGRLIAGALTSVLSGEAYAMSAKIASIIGPFNGYAKNRQPMLRVIRKHSLAAEQLMNDAGILGIHNSPSTLNGNGHATTRNDNTNGNGHSDHWQQKLFNESVGVWREAIALGEKHGYRNSQATVLAPTGTIAFLMDCDTTGVEPSLALVQYKKLVGGGTLKIVNNQTMPALSRLGYTEDQIKEVAAYILENETIEGAPHVKPEHDAVFDCSFKSAKGSRSISHMGHIKMMAAVQPFVSGAISKTVNLPSDATIDDIRDVYMQSWKLGLKAVAVYRDGCKSVQPLSTSAEKQTLSALSGDASLIDHASGYTRIRLPEERPSLTHKFSIANHEGYLHIGMYPDTMNVGETFITIAKEGSTTSGLFDVIATLVSMCLQSGIPLKVLVKKFKDMRFEPSGVTINPQIPFAKSFIDYIFRYMGYKFLSVEDQEEVFGAPIIRAPDAPISNGNGNLAQTADVMAKVTKLINESTPSAKSLWGGPGDDAHTDAPVCECGSMMFRAGSCFSCPNCFATTGVCN